MNTNLNQIILEYTKTELDEVMGQVQESDLSQYLCYYWAYIFYKLYGGTLCSLKIKAELKNEKDIDKIYEHAFVIKNDYYYDSRYSTSGLKDIQHFLPNSSEFNINDYFVKEYDNEDDFLNDWNVLDQKTKYDKAILKIKRKLTN